MAITTIKHKLIKHFFSTFVIVLIALQGEVLLAMPQSDESPTRLFFVERSKNKNIVCYDANILATGQLDLDKPVNVYWINYEDRPGERNDLNAIQRRLAYGYKFLNRSQHNLTIALHACKNRPIEIKKIGSKYSCLTQINNTLATLVKVYVKTKENNSLSVEYIELSGITLDGSTIKERIIE